MKTRALEAIGETGLQSLAQIDAALGANDRLKYYLSLLQMAIVHADRPGDTAPDLGKERLAAGVPDAELDKLVSQSARDGPRYRIPHVGDVLARLAADLRVMALPILAAPGGEAFAGRLDALIAAVPIADGGLVDAGAIVELARPGGERDSLHQLVMDLHRRLNALQASLAEELLDGAAVYRLDAADRPLVSAFMAGVNRTAPLAFGHPGLGTTATRAQGRLVIQNDIGETEAHVLVVHVEGRTIVLTYADVHPERLAFFQEMLGRFAVAWDCPTPTLAQGRFEAADDAECRTYLEWLGSRLVFLIDWNRARKELRGFLRGKDRLAVLRWGAQEEVGHRAFLVLGAARRVW